MTPEALGHLTRQLIHDEGYRRSVYYVNDPFHQPVPHVGVGHNLRDKPLSDRAVTQILNDDLTDAVSECEALAVWPDLDEVRQAVLVQMCFQLGFSGLNKSPNMLAALARGDYQKAAEEMVNGPWHEQTPERADRLAAQMRTGGWT